MVGRKDIPNQGSHISLVGVLLGGLLWFFRGGSYVFQMTNVQAGLGRRTIKGVEFGFLTSSSTSQPAGRRASQGWEGFGQVELSSPLRYAYIFLAGSYVPPQDRLMKRD